MKLRRQRMTREDAETLALQGLTFLTADPQRLVRFFSLTGLAPQDLRGFGQDTGLQAAVLEHLLDDESLLVVFAAEAGLPADQVAPAHALLAGPPGLGSP